MRSILNPSLLAAAFLTALALAPSAAADNDPFPDSLEATVCGFAQVANAVNSLPPEAGRCVDNAPPSGAADDYVNPAFQPCSGCDTLTLVTLLHQTGIGVPSEPLPPTGTGGTPVPDVPSQPGQPVPDHPGAGPVVTPGVGQDVGVLSTRDSGANYCLYFTPEGGSEQLLACVGRAFLGPLDGSAPRGDRPLVFYDPMDVPATGPIVTPDVPPTSGQPTPDVPPVPTGSFGNSPALTMDVDVSYRYASARLTPFVNVLGQQTWSPIGPTLDDAQWFASPTNPASLTVTVTVYKDGVSQGTVGRDLPALGQVLAAAVASA